MKKIFYVTCFLLAIGQFSVFGQDSFTLEYCRDLALKNSKSMLISEQKIKAAHYAKKSAFTSYLPSVDATGTYLRNQREISVFSDDVKNSINGVGQRSKEGIYSIADIFKQSNPELTEALQKLGDESSVHLNNLGDDILRGVRTDTRNIYLGQITLTQPLYMGGKIRAYNKITKFAEEIAKEMNNLEMQNVILGVDEAYWRVISLVNKKKLSESYLELLNKINQDVNHLIDEGVATKADGLAVMVKVNEAEMILQKVSDGLTLSKMSLCQLCGIEITADIKLADEELMDFPENPFDTKFNLYEVYNNRPEIKGLALSTKINQQKVNVNRAGYLPQVALLGNYMVTNPSMFNGFEKKFKGNWNVGVMVKIPILHWGKEIYKTKEAKVEAKIAEYQLEEVKERIELQINQSAFQVEEANKRLKMAYKNLEKAQENLNYATYGFEEGVIPSNTVLEAHTNWLAAQSDKIDAQLDIKLTQTYFKKAVGTLSK